MRLPARDALSLHDVPASTSHSFCNHLSPASPESFIFNRPCSLVLQRYQLSSPAIRYHPFLTPPLPSVVSARSDTRSVVLPFLSSRCFQVEVDVLVVVLLVQRCDYRSPCRCWLSQIRYIASISASMFSSPRERKAERRAKMERALTPLRYPGPHAWTAWSRSSPLST